MDASSNELETSSEGTAYSNEQDSASWEQYMENRNFVLHFLHSRLNLHYLEQHQNNVELLKKCSFYLEIEPTHCTMTDQNHVTHHTDILQLIDPCRFQRMKQVGKIQTEIQLTLLTELLEELKRGREELSHYVETWDMRTFLSQLDFIKQRLSKLSEFMETLLPLQVPGELYVKHPLMSHANRRRTGVSNIRLSICAKTPLIFDRKKSFADKYWANLVWFTENQESHLEQCELHVNLLTNDGQTETGYGRIQEVTSDVCMVQDLQPGRSYKFTIRRPHTEMWLCDKWQDSIILKTKTNAAEDGNSSVCAPEG